MRKLLTIIALFIVTTAHAQTRAVRDANGNYSAVHRTDTLKSDKPTGKTFTDSKGKTYPLYISSRGKLYYLRTSRNGNVYKCYIHVDTFTLN